ncbi:MULTISPECIES: c-type cytochrome [Rhodobacterales]|uniref:Cytochrome c553 n=2 Tax=Roseobacteraceae TaxID=2854170 RepID=A0A2T0WCP8_9RHOB|nr:MULTISPECIES: cytochrome c [Roseobacteraceae]MEC8669424.1 c-type cytochrome [Pseudomonadota bacterium]MEE3070253.1 c-type cytochrome [Pseudomonadota bacterium]PRY84426.1 cytochrome c553 [Donghicola tyrosinivorans]CUH81894.1 putative bifunctional cbb3-type cytochrome c oxidase subunit II/cytochrome c [Tropicibacter naphthalenivorans]SMD02287.1 Cytochrome c553 [Tropicibacter naphthalenivorans]
MDKLTGLIGVVLIGGVAALGWQVFGAQDAPQGHSMVPPDTSNIAEGAPIAEVSLPDDLSASAKLGKTMFEAACAKCHGDNAAGQNGIAPPLVHKIYEPNHHGDMAFLMAAKNGVQSHHWNFGNMPKIDGVTDGDVKMIVAYVRELQRANGIN